ncbi:hypothetical protein BDV23DRAFT_176516 [Aspergillus alliaceus]|uniref:Major facilitator superfamily domain-containing protein n=1 Tax=Petromyces alliaceus TaxID=209559 RepID=A0A5N7BTE1_PETAA|nr:hypothetical protein BDV23DRAFT_176516 [Aspergillus alliaceus]
MESSLGALDFGFNNGWWGGALASVGAGTSSPGIILDCIVAPTVLSKLDHQKLFLVMSLLMLIGATLEASCSPPRIRGAFLGLYSFFNSFDVFLASIVVYLCREGTDKWQYLTIILCQLAVPIGYMTFYAFLSEFPRCLVYQGSYKEAGEVLRSLSNTPSTIAHEISLLKSDLPPRLLKDTNLRRTIIAISVQVLRQAQGVPIIQNYILAFMEPLQFPDPLRTNLMVVGCSFAAHIKTFFSFDEIGCRYSLCISSVLLRSVMFGTGIEFATGDTSTSSSPVSMVSIALLILWYYMEFSYVGAYQIVNPYARARLGGFVTFICGEFLVLAVVWAFLMVLETKGRSLEELDEIFQARVIYTGA